MRNMIKWLKKLFHIHEWEVIDKYTSKVYGHKWDGSRTDLPVKMQIVIVMQCKICGDVKTKTIIVEG